MFFAGNSLTVALTDLIETGPAFGFPSEVPKLASPDPSQRPGPVQRMGSHQTLQCLVPKFASDQGTCPDSKKTKAPRFAFSSGHGLEGSSTLIVLGAQWDAGRTNNQTPC